MGKEFTQEELEKLLDDRISKAIEPLTKQNNGLMAQILAGGTVAADNSPERRKKNSLVKFGGIMRCMAMAKNNRKEASEFAIHLAGQSKDADFKSSMDYVSKTLVGSTFGSGGAFVPEDLLPDVIEFLRPMSGLRRINPTILPNPSGNLHVPKLTNGATAHYRGEASDNNSQTPSTGDVVLTHKILDVIIPISRELLMTASPNVDAVIATDATRAIAQAEDSNFIRGAGSAYAPKGIKNLATTSSASAASNANDFANIKTDISGMEADVAGYNVPLMGGAYLMSHRTFINLRDLRNTQGFLFYPSLSTGNVYSPTVDGLPHLNGYPVSVTNNIPTNLGSGSDTELYFAIAPEIVIGEMTTMEVEMSMEASYKDANGTLVSAFTRGEMVMKLTARHDINLRHDQAVSIRTAVKY